MEEIIKDLTELENQYRAGGLYNVLYRVGLVPSFINSLTNDDSIHSAYEEWLDFNNAYALDYIESLILIYENQGIVNNTEISLYTQHEHILNRVCLFLCGKEVYTPPTEIHEKVSDHAMRILKEQLKHLYSKNYEKTT